MNGKTFLAALAGAVLLFLLGWLVFGILLMDYYQANTTVYEGLMNEMPNIGLIFLANLILALLYAYVFHRWASISTFTGGMAGGLVLGLPIYLMFDIWMISGMNLFTIEVLIVDVIVNTVMSMLMGGLIGWILGMGKKKPVSA